ncbi:MAG: zinc ribbon domain-containing protein [Actinomycetota bacterium]
MAIYQLSCGQGHRFEVIQSFTVPLPPCASCGEPTSKVPSVFGIGGRGAASLPPPAEAMPQTWRGTYEGNREYLTQLRRTAEQRQVMEARHPELAGDRRPILAHEGRYEAAPLRAGDALPSPGTGAVPSAQAEAPSAAPPAGHHHSHGGSHSHQHPPSS